MDDAQVVFMLGQHDTRLAAIERTTTQTAIDVRAVIGTLDRQSGAQAARAPYGVWLRSTMSAVVAAVLTAIVAMRFGWHK